MVLLLHLQLKYNSRNAGTSSRSRGISEAKRNPMVPLPALQKPQPSPVTWEPIPMGYAPPKSNTIEEATATHPRL
jgi:hypothetical protein